MLLGFQRRFEPYILDGSKQHTIRAKRKHPPKVGETCHCYGDVRQKSMHLLGRWPCTGVEDIRLEIARRDREGWVTRMEIYIEGMHLTFEEASILAWRDGFRQVQTSESEPLDSLKLMSRYWTDRFKEGIWSGDLIYWRFTPLIEGPK